MASDTDGQKTFLVGLEGWRCLMWKLRPIAEGRIFRPISIPDRRAARPAISGVRKMSGRAGRDRGGMLNDARSSTVFNMGSHHGNQQHDPSSPPALPAGLGHRYGSLVDDPAGRRNRDPAGCRPCRVAALDHGAAAAAVADRADHRRRAQDPSGPRAAAHGREQDGCGLHGWRHLADLFHRHALGQQRTDDGHAVAEIGRSDLHHACVRTQSCA